MQRNTLILLGGGVVQTVIALVTVPAYLSLVGQERFGAYVTALFILAYCGILERGQTVAIQNEIARLGPDAVDARSTAVWTAVALNALVGVLAGAVLLVVGKALFMYVLLLPADLRAESLDALPVLAACAPLVTISSVFQAALAGRERFAAVTLLDIIKITALQLLPLAFAYLWGPELVWLAAGNLAALALFMVSSVGVCLRIALPPRRLGSPSRAVAARLLHYGKWVTGSAVISPLYEMLPPIFIGAIRGASAVTTFVIPYNLAARLLIVPFSLGRVALPRLSAMGADESRTLGASSVAALGAVTAPLAVLGATLAAPFLTWWVGADLARDAAPIAAVLFMGVWILGLSYVPDVLLQAQSRPDLPTRLYALELIPFLLVLGVAVKTGGAFGAAIAWTSRVGVHSALLLATARLPWLERRLFAVATVVVSAAVSGVVFAFNTPVLLAVGTILTGASFVSAWVLSPPSLRAQVSRLIRRRTSVEELRRAASRRDHDD
ncbi:oligosaccharide flippase family protein [soil metagenome]